MHKIPKIVWLITPLLVFLILTAVVVSMIPKPKSVQIVADSATPAAQPSLTPSSARISGIDLLIQNITAYDPQNPLLAAPNLDMHISLPDEG
jgi:hypothetical protein